MKIDGRIITRHKDSRVAHCIEQSLKVDNLTDMETVSEDNSVVTTITGTSARSIIASVDDYLTNLSVAEKLCDCNDNTDNKLSLEKEAGINTGNE